MKDAHRDLHRALEHGKRVMADLSESYRSARNALRETQAMIELLINVSELPASEAREARAAIRRE